MGVSSKGKITAPRDQQRIVPAQARKGGGVSRETKFSPCRKYRYVLWRQFYSMLAVTPPLLPVEGNREHNYLMVIGLNPSTADETQDDPTIRRCIGFAKRWGYGALCMTNLFAWRATRPEDMKRQDDPCGPDNQHHLLSSAKGAGMVLAAWGKHGSYRSQDLTACAWLSEIGVNMHCLRENRDGSPIHPLYVASKTAPIAYDRCART